MKRLIYEAPAHHALNDAGRLYAGGEEFTVTDERAAELLADPSVSVVEAPDSALIDLTRGELDELAVQQGIESPGRLPNKDAVIAALSNLQSAAGDAGEGLDESQED